MDFVCPKCGGVLSLSGCGAKKCPSGHSFDRAKEGYYNLLLSSGGGTHGDNEMMLRARRDFLECGYYQPLADRLTETVLGATPARGCVLDGGCGEGYYTEQIERALYERDGRSELLAFDISKAAVKMTAKRQRRINAAVASAYKMPLPNCSVDTVVNVFSPMATDEVRRVLKTDGVFIIVYPGEDHLFALKSEIYDTPYKNLPESTALPGFVHESTVPVRYTMTFSDNEAIQSLFMMTPYAYRTNAAGRAKISKLDSLECEADFLIDVYRKCK